MLLNVKQYAQIQKQEQIALNKKFKLAEDQLNDLIDNIPTSDFDDLINSKIKKQIKDAYNCNLNATDISIEIRWNEIKDLFSEYNDKSIISEYVQAKANAKGYIVSRSDATDIARDRLYNRIIAYLKASNQNFKILTDNDIPFDDRQYVAIIVNIKL